ncbi:Hypothetical predicted protein [Mytilus galloprovincialis]|uniref:Ig-like domain-containing protein n=1 Tax=Mytilus galloprovincialis TaxID=29158 RepID=A0A8B6BRX7_MYTGA|nr:Hypothetical predicted protein [Mytilus galloprovincialis]
MFSKRIKGALENFAQYTTLHGINRIVSSKHVVGKLLWTCIALTCIAVCFMQIYKLGVQYGSKQVNTKVSIRYQKVYFPAVSFCNLNPVSYSKMKLMAHDNDLLAKRLVRIYNKSVTEVTKQFEKASSNNRNPPLNSTMQKSNYKVLYGGTVTLKCEVEGIPVPFKIQWFKQEGHSTINVTSENTYKYNHNFSNGSEISTASLTILNTDHNDAGVYICTARNINGHAISHTILLEIAGLALDIDPILSASEEFRLAMSYVDFKDDYINYTRRTIREMSADFSDFLLHCNFEGRPCNESVFVPFFDNYYGQCYRFPTEKITTRRAGPLFALKMLINVNQSDYVPYIASEAGIRLVIHEHGSQPYLENSGISVATGFRTDISLIQKRIERIPGSTECDPRNKFKNINSVKSKQGIVKNLLESTKPDIVLGTETWIDSSITNNQIFPPNYNIYRNDRNIQGGVLIAINSDNLSTPVSELQTNC